MPLTWGNYNLMQEGSVAIKKLKDEENYMKILDLFLIRLQELNPGRRAASQGYTL